MTPEDWKKEAPLLVSIIIIIAVLMMGLFLLNSCTLAFNNIHTRGTASDVVDDELTTDAKPSLTIPGAML